MGCSLQITEPITYINYPREQLPSSMIANRKWGLGYMELVFRDLGMIANHKYLGFYREYTEFI